MTRRRALLLLPLVLAAVLVVNVLEVGSFVSAASPAKPMLRLVASFPVPGEPSPATDIRWAGDGSVHLSRFHDGVVEVALQAGLPLRRVWVPDRETLGRFLSFTRLAASDTHIAVASHVHDVTWRGLGELHPGQMVDFNRKDINVVEDMDLAGDRLAVLGMLAAGEGEQFVPQGIAWLGSLSAKLTDLRPLLRDTAGPAAPRFNACALFGLGAVRFLPAGSLVVVPGSQPGAYLYSPDGTLLHSWSQAETGMDTDCGGVTPEQSGSLHTRPEELVSWINAHRVLDDILPLPAGPGLLVRSLGPDRKVHWELRVLGRTGVDTYEIPLAGNRPTDRLHGDVRNGRMVLLLSEHLIQEKNRHSQGRLFVVEMP